MSSAYRAGSVSSAGEVTPSELSHRAAAAVAALQRRAARPAATDAGLSSVVSPSEAPATPDPPPEIETAGSDQATSDVIDIRDRREPPAEAWPQPKWEIVEPRPAPEEPPRDSMPRLPAAPIVVEPATLVDEPPVTPQQPLVRSEPVTRSEPEEPVASSWAPESEELSWAPESEELAAEDPSELLADALSLDPSVSVFAPDPRAADPGQQPAPGGAMIVDAEAFGRALAEAMARVLAEHEALRTPPPAPVVNVQPVAERPRSFWSNAWHPDVMLCVLAFVIVAIILIAFAT